MLLAERAGSGGCGGYGGDDNAAVRGCNALELKGIKTGENHSEYEDFLGESGDIAKAFTFSLRLRSLSPTARESQHVVA